MNSSSLNQPRPIPGSDRPIRLLEVIGNAIVGGMESTVHNLITSLPAERFEITCLCPYESPFTAKLRAIGCAVYITPIRDDPPWAAIELATTLIQQQQIDVVHAHLLNAHTLAAISGKIASVPVVATIHSMNIWAQEISVARVAGSHLVTVCQQAFFQASASGIAAENLSLIPNGVDTDRYRPATARNLLRDRLKLPAGARLLGFVGRLSPEKGPDKFVLAADRICSARPDVHVALVGEGPERPMLEEMIARSEFGDRIHLAGAWPSTEEIYPAFDMLLQTSRSEAMPLALMEAMACGLPVVALAVGGVAEIIEADTTGIHISPVDPPGVPSPYPGDWGGVARAALDLLGQPDRCERMGLAARKRVVEHFNLVRNAEQMAALFDRLSTHQVPARSESANGGGTEINGKIGPRTRLHPVN